LSRYAIAVPRNVIQVEPVGYLEILELMVRSTLVLSDSGTLIEEAAILGIPSIQMRRSTERPEVYDWQCSVKFDPGSEQDVEATINRALSIKRGSWKHDFGDGKASVRIVDDICKRIEDGSLKGHDPKLWGRIAERSYKSEVL
jgi:UDP-N-acetylglucosamine 2-epimerase